MKIKSFSDKVGVPVDTIRYYEKMGLLHPKRLHNGYRQYDENCIAQLKMIIVLKHLGFSLNEIYQLTVLKKEEISLECNESAINLFDEKIKQLAHQINFYKNAVETLQKAKELMENEQYEKNKKEIEYSIEQLFNQLKAGERND